jgi:hypothetical protein
VDFDLGKPREKWEKLWILPMKTHKHMAKVWKNGGFASPISGDLSIETGVLQPSKTGRVHFPKRKMGGV